MRARLLGLALLFPFWASSQSLKPADIFGSSMVFQQKSAASVWGRSLPNAKVEVVASWGAKASTISDGQGAWKVAIKTPKAGGPYQLTIKSGKESVSLSDVLVGEVWVCSGQSNMEMTLAGWPPVDTIRNSAKEIGEAKHPNLRFITVERCFSADKQEGLKGSWKACSPQTAKSLSATAYFFGRQLQKELNVPVGLIVTAWGGTAAEAWVAPEYIKQHPDYANVLDGYPKAIKQQEEYIKWLATHPKVVLSSTLPEEERWKNLDFGDAQYASTAYNDAQWKSMMLPKGFESETGDFDGVVWFRKMVSISKEDAMKAALLSLAKIDDMDRVYVNGTLVGATETLGAWQVQRKYAIPEGVLKEGDNVIAVRVVDNSGGGGIWGDSDMLSVGIGEKKIALSGSWKYLPIAQLKDGVFYVFDDAEFAVRPKLDVAIGPNSPAMLFNGMVNPLIPFTIKGAIWYQGEANVGRAEQYCTLFPLMVESWRKSWGIGSFPFYYTQIAPYAYSGAANMESAYIREAQRRAMATPNTGMAVTMDIGNVKTIHPSNKVDVGDRLARLALAGSYGKTVATNGPLFKNATFGNGKVVVEFSYSEGLKITGVATDEFEVAGGDGLFVPAEAKVVAGRVEVYSPKVAEPTLVRYGFRNGSSSILTNGVGLPASTFTTEKVLK
jgi:sialate O-acetylesterase